MQEAGGATCGSAYFIGGEKCHARSRRGERKTEKAEMLQPGMPKS